MRVPAGYTTVFPYLVVDAAATVIDFLVYGLGAAEIGDYEDEFQGARHD